MKKIIFIFVWVLVVFGYLWTIRDEPVKNFKNSTLPSSPSPKINVLKNNEYKLLFVPYWSLAGEIENNKYDEFIYFGISVNKSGVDKNEAGYSNIGKFLNLGKNFSKKFITVRMIDSDINSYVLKNDKLQKRVIEESIDIAKQNSFSGVVLDFEIKGLPFETFVQTISDFYSEFYKSAKGNNLKFYVTLYGDMFYRIRPYDAEFISKNSDKILIMTYDFHKANGNPGPNFPLYGKEIYGYDLSMMTNDFLKTIPEEKLVIIFGMYGYDWVVDEKGKSKQQASSLSLNKIKTKFYPKCSFSECLVKRDEKSGETRITYVDNNREKHIVWFEDEESVKRKINYLKVKGINQIGYWAYSYF